MAPAGIKLQGKEIGVAISTYGSAESYLPGGANRFTIEEIVRPIEALSHFISATYLPPFALSDVSNVTDEQLEQSIIDYVNHITSGSACSFIKLIVNFIT